MAGLGACGDDDEKAATTPAAASQPATLALQVSAGPNGRYRMRAPRSVPSGLVAITLRAPDGKATHDAQVVRVDGSQTAAEVVAAVMGAQAGKPIPPWLVPVGGVGQTDGGTVGRSVQALPVGIYVALDMDEPEGDRVKSYAERGAAARFEVTGPTRAPALPTSRARITADEYRFTTTGLTAGRNRVRFKNDGVQPHHLLALPMRPGVTTQQIKRFLTSDGEPTGPPPVDFAAATRTAALDGGREQLVDLDLRPGKYALVCFTTDRQGGPPHAVKGMMGSVDVR